MYMYCTYIHTYLIPPHIIQILYIIYILMYMYTYALLYTYRQNENVYVHTVMCTYDTYLYTQHTVTHNILYTYLCFYVA
jgi:hypothetical protein